MSAMELDGAPPATNESDDDEEQFVAPREFTAAEREEAERLHRTAVRAEVAVPTQCEACFDGDARGDRTRQHRFAVFLALFVEPLEARHRYDASLHTTLPQASARVEG